MNEVLTQLGVGGILVILVLREVFRFLSKKRDGVDHAKMAREVTKLLELHLPTDEDGVPLWYVRRSFERKVIELTKVIEAQAGLMREIILRFKQYVDGKG